MDRKHFRFLGQMINGSHLNAAGGRGVGKFGVFEVSGSLMMRRWGTGWEQHE